MKRRKAVPRSETAGRSIKFTAFGTNKKIPPQLQWPRRDHDGGKTIRRLPALAQEEVLEGHLLFRGAVPKVASPPVKALHRRFYRAF